MGFADVNGDGLLDIWTLREPDNRLVVRFNQGRGAFGAAQEWADLGGAPPPAGFFGFADLNADGRADLWYVAGDTLYVATSSGAGLRSAEAWAAGLPALDPRWLRLRSVLGQGPARFLVRHARGRADRAHRAWRGAGPARAGRERTWCGHDGRYRSMTDPEFYVKSSGASYPVIDLQVPIHVVSDTAQPTARAGSPARRTPIAAGAWRSTAGAASASSIAG